jgi:hypothetical protein
MTDSPLTRLIDLAAVHGITPEQALTRLLDADPHDHQHRCPTCARLEHRRPADPDHPSLFVVEG